MEGDDLDGNQSWDELLRSVCVSGSEISWHLIVPFLFHQACTGKHTNTHPSTALFLPHFVPNMSPWTVSTVVALSGRGVWGKVFIGCSQPPQTGTWPHKSCRVNLYTAAECFPNTLPISQTHRHREGESQKSERERDIWMPQGYVWEPGRPIAHTDILIPYKHPYMGSLSKVTQKTLQTTGIANKRRKRQTIKVWACVTSEKTITKQQ